MIGIFVKENKGELPVPVNTQQSTSKKRTSPFIDMKGAVALSATIIAFLMALTLVQTGINSETLPDWSCVRCFSNLIDCLCHSREKSGNTIG